MHISLADLAPSDRYKLLCGVVLPRPIAWVTTISPEGVVNAAPFSFFNVFGEDPATVVLGLQHHPDGRRKDTTRNIEATGEFVINIATPDLNEALVASAAAYAPDESEPQALSLALAPSVLVKPPRLADVPVALECRKTVALGFGPGREVLIGEALGIAARDGLIDPVRLYVDWQGDYPVARLFADRYAKVVEIERRTIPEPKR